MLQKHFGFTWKSKQVVHWCSGFRHLFLVTTVYLFRKCKTTFTKWFTQQVGSQITCPVCIAFPFWVIHFYISDTYFRSSQHIFAATAQQFLPQLQNNFCQIMLCVVLWVPRSLFHFVFGFPFWAIHFLFSKATAREYLFSNSSVWDKRTGNDPTLWSYREPLG